MTVSHEGPIQRFGTSLRSANTPSRGLLTGRASGSSIISVLTPSARRAELIRAHRRIRPRMATVSRSSTIRHASQDHRSEGLRRLKAAITVSASPRGGCPPKNIVVRRENLVRVVLFAQPLLYVGIIRSRWASQDITRNRGPPRSTRDPLETRGKRSSA
jgi:hypothetical protein